MLSGPGTVKATTTCEFTYPGTFVNHPRRRSFHSLRRTSMTKLHRSTMICWLFLGVLLLVGTSRAQTRPPIVEQLAKTYGLDSWGQIDAVRYTFNIQIPALKLALARRIPGSGSPKPAKLRTSPKIRTASLSRLPTIGRSSTTRRPT